MTSTLIYARFSKDVAGEQLGVARQERLCRNLAERDGLTVLDVLVDNDVSATSKKKRPSFERLFEMVGTGQVDAVVTYHPDRLYRRPTDLERLVDLVESNGTQVHTVAAGSIDLTTASGRMVARMLGVIARGEVERLGERVRAKGDELAAGGKAPGGKPPFGYRRCAVNGHHRLAKGEDPCQHNCPGYVVEQTEVEALRFMAGRVLEGASLLAVARELNARGTSTREGRGWHHASVRASLVNPAITGLRVHRRKAAEKIGQSAIAGPGTWEPVLDRQTWEEVRAVLADPARKRKRPARSYLLGGMVTNPNGDLMRGRPDRGPGGAMDRRCYATQTPANPSLSIGADALESLVVAKVLESLDNAVLPVPEPNDTEAGEVEAIEAELAELAALRGAGSISLAEWMAAREPLTARLEAAQASAGAARRPPPSVLLASQPGAVRKGWPTLDFSAKREIISAVVERVEIGPASRGRWTPLEERVTVVWKA